MGLRYCEGKYVIRCDADDVNVSERFKILVKEFIRHEVDVLGSQVLEFSTGQEGSFQKLVPTKHNEIKSFASISKPDKPHVGNFRKSSVLAVGGYPYILFKEDYGLWLKMIDNGYIFENLQETLVNVRVNSQFFATRWPKTDYK